MPLKYGLPNGTDGSLDLDCEDAVVSTLFVISGAAPPKARRRFDLGRTASGAEVLAAAGGVDVQRFKPLTLSSSGIYTEKDYLAQFEEAWEVEEYAGAAAKVVARNQSAWQPPGPYVAALNAAVALLADAALAKQLFPDDQWKDAADAFNALRVALNRAIALGATEVCFEFGE